MWVAVHAYVTFTATGADRGKRVLLEESVVLMEVETHQDVYNRLGELKEMLGPGSCVYPGYESTGGLGIRKVVSVLNLDDDSAMPPSDKSELTYELYEFADDAAAGEFIEGKRVHAKMQKEIMEG